MPLVRRGSSAPLLQGYDEAQVVLTGIFDDEPSLHGPSGLDGWVLADINPLSLGAAMLWAKVASTAVWHESRRAAVLHRWKKTF